MCDLMCLLLIRYCCCCLGALHPRLRRRRDLRPIQPVQHDSPNLRHGHHFPNLRSADYYFQWRRQRRWWLFGGEVRPVRRHRVDWMHDLRCKLSISSSEIFCDWTFVERCMLTSGDLHSLDLHARAADTICSACKVGKKKGGCGNRGGRPGETQGGGVVVWLMRKYIGIRCSNFLTDG